jgi:hypothetical protein
MMVTGFLMDLLWSKKTNQTRLSSRATRLGDLAMTQLSRNFNGGSPSRRRFVQTTVATLAAISAPRFVHAGPDRSADAKTVVGEFFHSLTDAQRSAVCREFDDSLMHKVNPNWHVSKPLIGDSFYNQSQRAMIDKIVRDMASKEGYERLIQQMEDDDGGLDSYSVAMFGKPDYASFQWLLTGRHVTLRTDGNTIAGRAFGGPIVYGHGEEDPSLNLFHYQTKRANEVFASLDPAQAAKALGRSAPPESKIELQGKNGQFAGISVGDLSADQQTLVSDVLGTLFAPYRAEDAEEAMALIEAGGGVESLRFAFYSEEDLEQDGVWDMWRIEGPNAVIHFRGAPHVHAYIHIASVA